MFGTIGAKLRSAAGGVYSAAAAASKSKAVRIGAGVVAAGAAVYFAPAIAACVNPKEVCTPKSCYWGLKTCMECAVPETFCQTAIESVKSAMSGVRDRSNGRFKCGFKRFHML